MDARIKEFLKPEVLNTINGLELMARIVVEGFMSGSNKSQSVGAGQEFSQYRSYQSGDDLRQLDWKMFARSERYYIKQADIETNITVKFILDTSHSMSYTEQDITKLQYAKLLAAALAYLARKQSDTFGLYAVNDKSLRMVPPRFEQQQFVRFLSELIILKAEGSWGKGSDMELLFDHHGKELIVFITDMYDDTEDLQRFISRLKTPRNEVVIFHLIGQHERDLDFGAAFTFEDLESGQRTKVDTLQQQEIYTQKVNHWLKETRTWMLEKQIGYYLVSMKKPLEEVLRDFLTVRKRLLR
jgi:uncharacterized protein (DUF58 family)